MAQIGASVVPQDIGHFIKRWHVPNKPATTCVITAHGSKRFRLHAGLNLGSRFDDVTLKFYTQHGFVTNDVGIGTFMDAAQGAPPPVLVEEIPANQSQDYVLYKYTNSDNTQLWKHNEGRESYATTPYSVDFSNKDVITIRDRGGLHMSGVTLSTVLKELAEQNIFYDIIICAFCRGGKDIPSGAFPSWNAERS